MSNTNDRDLACRTAPRDPERALDFARRIPDEWFRAQALACVARHAPEKQVEHFAEESLRSAREAGEPYRRVAVAAWPIRALIERQRMAAAKRALLAILELVPQVEPESSRAEALALIWQAVFPGGNEFRTTAWEVIARHCAPDSHWRVARLYACVVWTLATEDVHEAARIVARMPEGKAKLKAAKLLRQGKAYPPRAFFHAAA